MMKNRVKMCKNEGRTWWKVADGSVHVHLDLVRLLVWENVRC